MGHGSSRFGSHLIRKDDVVRAAFQEFSRAAKKCEHRFVRGTNLIARKVSERVSARYRDIFLQAASAYARKLSKLESSIDRLSSLPLADLESLAADGDDLTQRIAAIGLKISDEIKQVKGFDVDVRGLLRMDPAARYDAHSKAVGGGWMAPNEARAAENMAPVPGGDTPYLQQQNYSLRALAERDKDPAPSSTATASKPESKEPTNGN